MRTTKLTTFTPTSGANVQCLTASKSRVRVEFHYGTSSSQIYLLDSPMTAANTGIMLNANLTTKVFTIEEHGDIVTRNWHVWGSAANLFVIAETFDEDQL